MNTESTGYRAGSFDLRGLATFFGIVFGLRWLVDGLLAAGILQKGTGLGLALQALASWGPLIAAFTVSAIMQGKAGPAKLWRRFWNRNTTWKWLMASLLFIPLIALGTNPITRVMDGPDTPWFFTYEPTWTFLTAFLVAFIGNGVAEEFGWRGFVLPRFQVKWNALTSSLVLGATWALWHAGQWFIPGSPLYGRNPWLWAAGMLMLSVIMTWIFNNTRGSLLGVILVHALWNTGIFYHKVDARFYGAMLVVTLFIVVLFGVRRLVRGKIEENNKS